jgi:HSP20 family molecular chaperone IbpA
MSDQALIQNGERSAPAATRLRTRMPAVDIRETDDAIVLLADMPGVAQDGIDITVHQDLLTVHGTVKPEGHGAYRLVHQEYQSLDFERSFTVPPGLDLDRVAATVSHGVVRVTLPKAKAAAPRRIAVTDG